MEKRVGPWEAPRDCQGCFGFSWIQRLGPRFEGKVLFVTAVRHGAIDFVEIRVFPQLTEKGGKCTNLPSGLLNLALWFIKFSP